MEHLRTKHTNIVKKIAQELGFDFCGVAKAEFLEDEAPRLEQWLNANQHGQMHYMTNHFDKRLDPRLLVDGAKSVISVLYNYYPAQHLPQEDDNYRISTYAYGTDYHLVIKEKLKTFLEHLREEIGEINGRAFVDSAPVMDKVWAKRAGLGWVGKHSNLISREIGSFFFIAELITDLDLTPDEPIADYCGTCTRCLDACPTDAIIAPYVVDGSRCISYFTIELKEAIPETMKGTFENWIFGCDICQDVCPWNRFARPTQEPQFSLSSELQAFTKQDWEDLEEDTFQIIFKKSPLKRSKWEGLKRNIEFVKGK